MGVTRTRVLNFALAAAIVCSLAAPAAALAFESPNTPSSGGLVEEPKKYDGEAVTFQGEAIGEAMVRGDDAWIHLNDDAYMFKNVEEGAALEGYNSGMSVWLPADQTAKITTFGDYKHEGDVVTVAGKFNAACAQHGGDMDIHATSLELVTPGHVASDPVKPWKLVLAVVLSLLGAGVWYADKRAGHREQRGLMTRR